jgi:hypothetical protein
MNEIFATEPLESGQSIKIAIREPYRPLATPPVGAGPPTAVRSR